MLDATSRPLAVLLILCLSPLPVPWGHTHADLDGQPLARHLQQYHETASEADVPQGWHLHLLLPTLCGPCDGQGGLTATASDISPEQRAGFGCPTSFWMRALDRAETADRLLAVSHKMSSARAVLQQHLYQRLRVLLI